MAKSKLRDTGNFMEVVFRSCGIRVNDGTSAANKAMEITERLAFSHYSYTDAAAKRAFLSYLEDCQLCITPDAGLVAHMKERGDALKSWDAANADMLKYSNFLKQIHSQQAHGQFFAGFFKGAMQKVLEESSLEAKEDDSTPLLLDTPNYDDEVAVSGSDE